MHASVQIDGTAGDVELVRQVVAGSEAALAAIYDQYAATVFRAALRLQRDHALAEDVVQETFLALWNRAEKFDPSRGSLGGWLAAIARNRAIDKSRAEARRIAAQPFSVVAADQPDEAATVDWLLASGTMIGTGTPERQPDELVATGETLAVIGGAVAELSDEERQAILLAYRDGLSQSEIAARLDWPIGTVKTRSRRALRRLRERLQAPAGTGEPGAAAPPRAARSASVSATAGCTACP
jgi:RNA polymerase sigma-70 factor (ECF subfamily)